MISMLVTDEDVTAFVDGCLDDAVSGNDIPTRSHISNFSRFVNPKIIILTPIRSPQAGFSCFNEPSSRPPV